MSETPPSLTERRCLMCERVVQIVAKVGPLQIKAPCPNKCRAGYAKAIRGSKD